MSHAHAHAPADARRTPDPAIPVPPVAWPTVALFLAAVALAAASTTLALRGTIQPVLGVALNTVASFLFFTVLHESVHRTAGTGETLNVWLARFSALGVTPIAAAPVFRFIHMQHHMHTNEDDGSDPDHWTNAGPAWSTPLRWATIDLAYVPFYLRRAGRRPRRELIESAVTSLLLLAIGVALMLNGHLIDVLVYYILPTRLAIWFLGYAFDWLPHHGLEDLTTDRYRATRNRIGWERLLTPLLLYQNYHLVHHLHPRIPFYRYIAAWRRNEDAYLAHDPALATPLGRELTVDEYRSLRS